MTSIEQLNLYQRMEKYRDDFQTNHTGVATRVYEQKVKELSARIEADIGHTAEIIVAEIKDCEIMQWRARLTDKQVIIDEWLGTNAAIEDIARELCKIRPL